MLVGMMHLHSEMANDFDCSPQADEREESEPTTRVPWENRVVDGAPIVGYAPPGSINLREGFIR
jgi:hypothetical protein